MKFLNGVEEIIGKALLFVVVGFLAPLGTWILLIEMFVIGEYLSQRMLKRPADEKRKASFFMVKAFLYLVALAQARGLEGAVFPETPLTEYIAASILVYQFKLTLSNISEYAGVNILEGIAEALQKTLNELLKYKKK